jgi:hypothetical protein
MQSQCIQHLQASRQCCVGVYFKDIWMSVLTFTLLAATIGIGIWRLIADGIVRSTWNFG